MDKTTAPTLYEEIQNSKTDGKKMWPLGPILVRMNKKKLKGKRVIESPRI